MTDKIAVLEGQALDGVVYDLQVSRPPEMVLEEARRAARALKDVIEAKEKKVIFNGEQYLEFEDWQTVGRFYGISPRIPETGTRYVEYGGAKGWEAFAEAIDVRTGRVVSSASAMCLDDEEKWSSRPKYAWQYVKKSGGYSTEDPGKDELIWERQPDGKNRPKKERRLIGEEGVPLFQLRSMAQTRAGAKALRNALAWVVVLAGYRPTPAEEMDGLGPGPALVTASASAGRSTGAPESTGGGVTPSDPNDPALVQESENLFRDPQEDVERERLLNEARRLRKKIKMSDKETSDFWSTYIGPGVTPSTADIAALGDMVKALKVRGGE